MDPTISARQRDILSVSAVLNTSGAATLQRPTAARHVRLRTTKLFGKLVVCGKLSWRYPLAQ